MDMQSKERMLFAIKSGVVPNIDLEEICFGREEELKEIDRCLEFVKEGNGALKFITGSYGVGKSFLLSTISQKALRKNFIVANVQISKSLKFNKLEDLYFHIMHNLHIQFDDSNGTSFEEIFDLWIDEQKRLDPKMASVKINNVIKELNNYNSTFATVILSFIKAKINKEVDLSRSISGWIKGEKNIPASVKSKFGVKSDINKENVMQFLKAFIKLIKLLDYNGAIIVVDELELIVNDRKDIRTAAYENVRMITDMLYNGELRDTMFIFASTNEIFENEEKGIKTYAALYRRLSSGYENNLELRDLRQPVMKIDGLKVKDIFEMTKKVISIHSDVYNWQIDISDELINKYIETISSTIGNENVQINSRQYLKRIVEILDIMEQNRGINLFEKEIENVQNIESDIYVDKLNLDINEKIDDEVIEF